MVFQLVSPLRARVDALDGEARWVAVRLSPRTP